MHVEMRVQGLMIDPITQQPMIVLRDPQSDAKLPMWIGAFEANAIALELEHVKTPRPMTHDLLAGLLDDLSATLTKIVITDLQENTFFAVLHLDTPDGAKQIDSRPSDAIALALRCDAQIWASEEVIESAKNIDLTEGYKETERFREWLEGLGEDDLGKYEM